MAPEVQWQHVILHAQKRESYGHVKRAAHPAIRSDAGRLTVGGAPPHASSQPEGEMAHTPLLGES